MMAVVIAEQARADLRQAVDWYTAEQAGLGERFRAAVERQLNTIAELPMAFALINQIHRRVVMQRYPYAIYYRVEESTVVVVAVLHGRRGTRHVSRRLRSDRP